MTSSVTTATAERYLDEDGNPTTAATRTSYVDADGNPTTDATRTGTATRTTTTTYTATSTDPSDDYRGEAYATFISTTDGVGLYTVELEDDTL